MYNKIYLTILAFIVFAKLGYAQTNYQKTDSISIALYNQAKWDDLIHFGKTAIANGDDFPALRLRMGYASFETGNYSAALQQYQKVLATDAYNQIALYYAYLCNIYLNRPKEASYLASSLTPTDLQKPDQPEIALTLIGTEASFKFTDNQNRGNALYNRFFAQLRLGHQFFIDNSVLLYNQYINMNNIGQAGNHLKLSYLPVKNLELIGAWNYSNAKYLQIAYVSNTLLFGARYVKPYYYLQADASLLKSSTDHISQYNFQIFNVLTGNLNFYLSNKISLLSSSTSRDVIYNPLIGAKAAKNIWVEAAGTFGKQYNFTEADGLYQYNGLDVTDSKFALNGYILVKKQLLLSMGYTLENKTENLTNNKYLQHSINTNITWHF